MVKRKTVECFIQLSMEALEKDDIDHLGELFRQRREAMDRIDRAGEKLTRDELTTCITREKEIAARLRSMQRKTLEAMDKLGRTRKAVKGYASKPSTLSHPVYCDIKI